MSNTKCPNCESTEYHDLICPECNGSGEDDDSFYICSNCCGHGIIRGDLECNACGTIFDDLGSD